MNENVCYLHGISGYELEAMEAKFRDECVAAAPTTGEHANLAPVYFQIAGSANELRHLPMPPETTLTVAEAYTKLAATPGLPTTDYHRLPIADESAPPETILTALVELLRGSIAGGGKTALVFNCQMGRGRTTTGMVCAAIMMRAVEGFVPPAGSPTSLPASDAPEAERDLDRGQFKGVLRLVVLLDDAAERVTPSGASSTLLPSYRRNAVGLGLRAKFLADSCAETCSEAQNLVSAIIKCKRDAATADPNAARSPAFWMARGQKYLERYAVLICFAAYTLVAAPSGFTRSFSAWMHQHWQLKRVIDSLSLE